MNLDTLRRIFPTGFLSDDNKSFLTWSSTARTNTTILATASDYVTWALSASGTTAAATNEVDADAVAAGAQGVGASPVSTSVATESSLGVQRTLLTLTDVAQTVTNGTEYQGTKIYTFPEGRILVLGVTATLAQKTTSAILTTLNGSSTGAISLGTATASNVSLTGTMVDLLPSTAFTSSATINVAGTAVSAALGASAQFNGTATAIPVYLNTAYATTTDVDGNATQTITGTVAITWVSLGDY
tara:strand:+ start:759 stop:1487 length:729 start_codon:yes stop_codon:yes gene_type:complete